MGEHSEPILTVAPEKSQSQVELTSITQKRRTQDMRAVPRVAENDATGQQHCHTPQQARRHQPQRQPSKGNRNEGKWARVGSLIPYCDASYEAHWAITPYSLHAEVHHQVGGKSSSNPEPIRTKNKRLGPSPGNSVTPLPSLLAQFLSKTLHCFAKY
jgi:hypothetical protein